MKSLNFQSRNNLQTYITHQDNYIRINNSSFANKLFNTDLNQNDRKRFNISETQNPVDQ